MGKVLIFGIIIGAWGSCWSSVAVSKYLEIVRREAVRFREEVIQEIAQ
jgi:hypothetical protein